jgi:hypothetical protein
MRTAAGPERCEIVTEPPEGEPANGGAEWCLSLVQACEPPSAATIRFVVVEHSAIMTTLDMVAHQGTNV